MPLSERIKERRKSCGMSQEMVAELVGVSRQAVTKWEAGRSAPSTENLIKLAEIWGTTVEELLAVGERENTAPVEEKRGEGELDALRAARKRNLLAALIVAAGYLTLYFLGRIWGTTVEQTSVMGWLFGTDPQQHSYLYGWLLQRKLFWLAMLISAAPALWGKYRFSFTTLSLFGVGWLAGELFGANPAGAAWGQSHYGWAIWGGIFGLSLVLGIALEKLSKPVFSLRSKKVWLWFAASLAGVIAVVLLVRSGIPKGYGG